MRSACESCGRTAETREAILRQNIGALVGRLSKTLEGRLCRRCILRQGASMTLVTALIGWASIVSLLVAPFVVVTNLLTMVGALGMHPSSEREEAETDGPEDPVVELTCPWCTREFRRPAHGRDVQPGRR